MAERKAKTRRGEKTTRADEDIYQRVDLGGGLVLPQRFTTTYRWDDTDTGERMFDVVVVVETDAGGPRITSAHFRSSAGLPLDRLKREWDWSWLLNHTVANYAEAFSPESDQPMTHSVVDSAIRTAAKKFDRAERYRRVAEAYRGYPRRDVTRHVQRELDFTSYGTARRWIFEARTTIDPDTGQPYLEPAGGMGKRSPAS